MARLNERVAVKDGLLVAKEDERCGMPVYVIYLLDSTRGPKTEVCMRMSKEFILTKLDQLIKKG